MMKSMQLYQLSQTLQNTADRVTAMYNSRKKFLNLFEKITI